MPRLFRIILILVALVVSCSNEPGEIDPAVAGDESFPVPDWTDATHGNDAAPDYEMVFDQDKVNTIEIEMTADDWTGIKSNMKSLFGFDFGTSAVQGGMEGFPTLEPDYVAVSLKFENKEWYKVGFRLKGNSSLRSSWRTGVYKLPFRLDFDEFEDRYEQIKNQRFYGFKELSMSPGTNDHSLIREKAGSDIFRMAGIPSSQTSFYKVYINFGEGLKYCGVYTTVEVVDDTMIENQFGGEAGNVYKPESNFQAFVIGQFEKKNNEDYNDYEDVKGAILALNSGIRLTDPAQWRANLEQSFNVDHFVKWLAINTGMMNWDTYGKMAHNYYLYNNPGNGLTWIPWDNNEAMSNRSNGALNVSLSGVNSNWPLIRYLMDDPVYRASYIAYMKEFRDGIFTVEKMNELFDRYHDLIAPYVVGPKATEQPKYTYLPNLSSFSGGLTTLKRHVVTQNQEMNDYLK